MAETKEKELKTKETKSKANLQILWLPASIKQEQVTKSYILENYFQESETPKEIWMIRHAQRIDETPEYYSWAKSIPENQTFDPPLTKLGYEQSKERGKILFKELSNIKNKPQHIYVSPLQRTIGTSTEIAKINKLEVLLIPGLSSCAAAIERGKLAVIEKKNFLTKKVKTELVLKKYGKYKNAPFLNKNQINKIYAKKWNINIKYCYDKIENNFNECVSRLIKNDKNNIILCITHREGMGRLDKRFPRIGVPYCAVMKFIYDSKNDRFFLYLHE